MRVSLLLALLLVGSLTATAQTLGRTDFPTSGSPTAQPAFLRGLLQLHSFEYEDARTAFQEARQLDPGFAMAAWGEAMTHNHPIWHEQDSTAARAALAGVTRDGLTPRETAYLSTLDVLYGAGSKEARDDAYALAMERLAATYPDDDDAQAFYALALLGTSHDGRDVATYMRAAAVAEEVFARNPQHPGATHYLIHAYDDPVHAPLGLRAARVYADLAPDAAHALHMPTHILFATGDWPASVALNERSFNAAAAASARRGDVLDGHGWHALYWWTYAELQRGRYDEARRLLAVARERQALDRSPRARSHLVLIRAFVADATGDAAVLDIGPPAPRSASVAARDLLARGRSLPAHAAVWLDSLEARGGGGASVEATRAQLAALAGRPDAMEALAQAAERDRTDPFMFGPPGVLVPPGEAYGDALLASGDAAAAAAAYRDALTRAPGRLALLVGLARATGDAVDADAVRNALRDADPSVRREVLRSLVSVR